MTRPLYILFFLLCFCGAVFSQQEANGTTEVPAKDRAASFLTLLQKQYADGEYQLHKAYSDSLLSVAKEYELPRMHVFALVNQAVYFNNRNDRHKAIELYHDALEQCKRIPEDFRAKTVVLVNMGNTYNNIGSYDKAIEAMKKVLIVTDSTENSSVVKAAALIGLANNYAELGDFEKTLEFAGRAKILGEKTKNESVLASALNNLIDAHLNLTNYEKAHALSEKALQLPVLEKPTKKRGWLLLNTGIANYHLNHTDTALEYFKACTMLAKEKGLLEIEMYGHEYLAKVYEKQEDYKASYASQKQYSVLREKHLNDRKEASDADLKKDITQKDEKIEENEEALLALSNGGKQKLYLGIALFATLGGLFFFYIKRKKSLEPELGKLSPQFVTTNQFNAIAIHEELQQMATQGNSDEGAIKPYKNSSLTPSLREEYKQKILAYMQERKPFLDADLNQSDLATMLQMSSHHFSEVLHYGFAQNFYNFINSYRVLEAQNLMKHQRYKDAKVIAIAFDAGFKSKTSFNRVFKKHTGQTPSEYRKIDS